MIFQLGQHMADTNRERGKIFSIQEDGRDTMPPLVIKKDQIMIGRGDSCEVRIYLEGVAYEHCAITFNEDGRGFMEPVNKCGSTFLNGQLTERQTSLEHDDVITIVKRSFRFCYPSSSKYYIEDSRVKALADLDVECFLAKKAKETPEKRVTFGPRLSPEEFDESMPPASPLRRGSLPREKFKTRKPSFKQYSIKCQIKKNLFMDDPEDEFIKKNEKSHTPGILQSSVLKRLSCGSAKQVMQKDITKLSRPLFSEIVKKSVNPAQITAQKIIRKYSPQNLIKRAKLKALQKTYKSPRPVHLRLLSVGSTGHANSPETIIIGKKKFSPDLQRNLGSSVKRRKSVQLLQENVAKDSSESHELECSVNLHGKGLLTPQNYFASENIDENSNLSRLSSKKNIPVHNSIVEISKSLAKTQKTNDKNMANISAEIRGDDSSFRKKSEDTHSEEKDRRSIGTLTEKNSATTPSKVDASTCTIKSSSTPIRKSIGITQKKNLDTPAKERICTLERKNQDELLNEDPSENDVLAEEVNETSCSSSLVTAINNVAQIDENNLDKSLNDIQNIVQALSCRSNVPTLGSDRLTADMCTSAVRKLAFTISMINAFHMYNRILGDVSSFPLGVPSTSLESNIDSLSLLSSTHHQNEDLRRLPRFQDIIQNFFANSVSSDRRRMLDDACTCEELNPDKDSPLSNKRSKSLSRNKVPLKATYSNFKKSTQKSTDSQVNLINDSSDVDESNNSGQSSLHNKSTVSSHSHSKSPKTSISSKEESSATVSRISELLHKNVSFNSPLLHATSTDELSFSNDFEWQKSKSVRMSSTSAERENSESRKLSLTLYSKALRKQRLAMLKKQRDSLVTKNHTMTTSKKLKLQKKEKHRSDVLKKVKVASVSPQINILKKKHGKSKTVVVRNKKGRKSMITSPKVAYKRSTRSTIKNDSENIVSFAIKSQSKKITATIAKDQRKRKMKPEDMELKESFENKKPGKRHKTDDKVKNKESGIQKPRANTSAKNSEKKHDKFVSKAVVAVRKAGRLNKAVETNKSKQKKQKIVTSPANNCTRSTRRKDLQTVDLVENKKIPVVDEDQEKVDSKKKGRKNVKKKKTKKPTKASLNKIKKDAKMRNDIPKDKEKLFTPKVSPKKGRGKGISRKTEAEKEVSPVQKVLRSLRSRK